MRLAHASLAALTAALALGLGFAACTDSDAEDYPVVPGASSATGGVGPGQVTEPDDDDDGIPVDGGLGPDSFGSLDGGAGFDGDFTPLEDAI